MLKKKVNSGVTSQKHIDFKSFEQSLFDRMLNIEKYIEEKGKLIDKEIELAFPKKSISNLYDAVWYHMNTGGKRLRPVLAIATCEALDGDSIKIVPFAAACEVLHNWILIHDDIEDHDKVRRNKVTVWVKYGIEHGINIGDLMSQKVFEMILKSREVGVDENTIFKLIKSMTDAAINTCEGQTMEMNLRTNTTPTEEDYINMITGKTAHYLTVPMIGGAIVAGADQKMLDTIIKFGKYIGPAFQITDDVLDLTEGKGRNEIGRDIKEGKRSILAIHCLTNCNDDERSKILTILNKTPEETTDEDTLYVKSLFERYGSIDYARKKAEDFVAKSKDVIKDLPPDLKDVFVFFAEYLIKRKK